jgi:ABC-type oligopeptide transport system substrate-binding subunit
VRRFALSTAAAVVGLAFLAAAGLGSTGQTSPSGVFRYSVDTDIDYVDPALAYYSLSWEIEYATCAMLVNYPDAPAPRGSRLDPEVARSFPQISKGGKVYTFALRKSYRFSNGSRITAASFAAAINRNLNPKMASPAQPFIEDVVGARAVIDGRARTASGVEVLSRYRLRITLTKRAPDFLARLAMPFFCPIPARLPINPDGISAPVVGSGPYYVEAWEPKRSLVLRRNPFYRGPRPHKVERVTYDIGLPAATIKLQIDRGATDHGPVPPVAHAELGPLHGVRKASPGRYFVNPIGTIRYLALNHDRPLFGKAGGRAGLGNVPLKKAVSFAIDRTALLEQRGAYAGVFNDQYLPPTMPGARNEAIYPPRPDVARARELAQGQTRGGKAVMYTCNTGPCMPIAQIVQANLREIGLDVTIANPRCGPFKCRSGWRGEPFDISLEVWHMDYFDPYDFLFLLDGSTIRPAGNVNVSYFNSPEYNRKIARAASLTREARYRAFGALDVELARKAAPLASYMTDNDRRYFSARVRGFFSHPVYGLDLAAIKVR